MTSSSSVKDKLGGANSFSAGGRVSGRLSRLNTCKEQTRASQNHGTLWLSSIIQLIWTHCYDEWINRHNALHGHNQQTKLQARTFRAAITALTWPVDIGSMSLQKHISQDKRILDIWRTGLHYTKLESLAKSPPSTTHANRSSKHRRILFTHHITQHLDWQFCTPSSHWRSLFAIFMLIAQLIRAGSSARDARSCRRNVILMISLFFDPLVDTGSDWYYVNASNSI
jgi:hypothetical protein